MQIKIFQVNMERDTDRIAFESMDYLQQSGHTVCPELYDKVFEGELDCGNLEDVYQMLNLNHPADYHGRSLSVSDVVAVRDPKTGKDSFHFCDSIGFQEIEFDESKAQSRTVETIRVVLVEPGKPARIADIEASLNGYYRAIAADTIQAVYPFEEPVCLIMDDEGKLKGSALNRALRDSDTGDVYDIVAGTFFVCSCKEDYYGSLDEVEQKKYLEMFRWPERFIQVNETIYAVPVKPQDRGEAR